MLALSLKCFVAEKRAFLSTSTQILKSVCVPWHYFKVCCRSKSLGHCIALSDLKNWLLTRIFL